MEAKEILNVLRTFGGLKDVTRQGISPQHRAESVAEHSWRAEVMVWLMSDDLEKMGVNVNRVRDMVMVHDLGELATGDIGTLVKTDKDRETESKKLINLIKGMPEPVAKKLNGLFKEMDEQKTIESKVYKCVDKFEGIITHGEADVEYMGDKEHGLAQNPKAFDKVFGKYACTPLLEQIAGEIKAHMKNKSDHETPINETGEYLI